MLQLRLIKMYLFVVFSLFLTMAIGNVRAADIATEKSTPVVTEKEFHFRPMTEDERISAMCVLGASTGMVASYVAGPSEVIMLVVGGLVVPSSSSILFWGLFGTIAAAGCTIGSMAAPATSWLYNHYLSNN